MESYEGGGDEFRGSSGPMHVKRPDAASLDPLSRAFIEAGAEAGYPLTDDKNGVQQEGFGLFDSTIRKGERWSTARGYLVATRLHHRSPEEPLTVPAWTTMGQTAPDEK